ncbi:MAG: ATP-binding cassette domain-containing protein [Lancefieldella parvula]|uniref:ATP-binding cassette domain-containing protein n=1 Tax=Lancefieldella parvula TaxID=1382 RepID=A0A9E7AIH9_9ACTN|nr:MAG: ATP-binding cassette domain-containing protein [Lancefieldella parvula]
MGILVGCEQISMEWPGKKVLTNQTIGVNEGDRIGVVGKNGDGKSTLLDLIAKRIEPDSGNVIWRSGIQVGYMGQSDSLSDTQTVCSAVVGDTPEYEWASDARVRKIIDELIGDLDWNGLVGELSGGQRRRCDLARLLVGTWDLMLIDEPTNHLDLHAIQWLANHLKNRWSEGNGVAHSGHPRPLVFGRGL